MLKRLWHDPVWSKVIAGTILALGAFIATYFLNLWPAIGEFGRKSIAFILTPTLAPNWLFLILALLALPTLILIGAFLWQSVLPSKVQPLSWQNYNTDIFFSLRWRWTYGANGQIHEVHTFCPNCDFQVYAENDRSYPSIDRIVFYCESCHRHLGEFQESFNLLENKVKRFVQQKIRNGKWAAQLDT